MMTPFLIVIGLAALFVLGPVLAMRPSPRQAQLARLRARAVAAGLRVRVEGARNREPLVEYVLPWRLDDLQQVRGLRLQLRRGDDGSWEDAEFQAAPGGALRDACEAVPAGVSGLRSVGEGLAAQWNEKGRDEDVDRIRDALLALREAVIARAAPGGAARGASDIRT
jgi:hypothetical protein